MGVSGKWDESAGGRGIVQVRLFGPLTALRDGQELGLGSPKQRALFAILLLHRGQAVSTDRLIDILWGDRPPRTAGHSLQVYVSELRQVLGSSVIRTERPGYIIDDSSIELDVDLFEQAAAHGRAALHEGDRSAADLLESAVAMWRGEPLADFEYEDFAGPEAMRMRALRLDTLDDLTSARLAAGEPSRALPVAEAVVDEDPLRESSRALLMLALYRCGRFPEALRDFTRYRKLVVDELGLDPSPRIRELYERILIHEPSLDPSPTSMSDLSGPPRNPYKGLRPFAEADADDFFGRDELIERIVDKLRDGSPLAAVVGPSGCGKSSVVAAGVLPRLRSDALPDSEQWTIVQPGFGTDPGESVRAAAAALAGAGDESGAAQDGTHLLLVLDQFEEHFIGVSEEAQRELLDTLCRFLAEGMHRVILTLRADMYDRPLRHPAFAEIFTAGVVNVLPMRAAELEAAVVAPARRVGVSAEPGLVAEIVADTVARPGLLPLLQYTLTELFEGIDQDELRLADFRQIGGLSGALARRAEQIRNSWTDSEHQVATQLFLRLVRVGHDGGPSRRRLPVPELAGLLELDSVAIADVVEGLTRHRLVWTDRELPSGPATLEVAHECLFEEWPWLHDLVDQHLTALRRHESLRAAVAEWEGADRDPDYLLTGGRLDSVLTASRGGAIQLTDAEDAFLDACEAHAVAGAAAVRVRRRRTRVRTVIAALAAAAVATVTAVLTVTGGSAPRRVAYVTSGFGYINDQVTRGVERAASDAHLDLAVVQVEDGNPSAALAKVLRDPPDLVIIALSGFDVSAAAAAHPGTRFLDLSGVLPGANVTVASFADQEGAFLAGAAAALASRSKVVGFLGGADSSLLRRFEAGFVAGAHTAKPGIRVLVRYASRVPDYSGFGDPVLAGRVAHAMLLHGADVLFPAAGTAQFGADQAVVERSAEIHRPIWAIGADVDLYSWPAWQRGPDDKRHILTSMIKRFDVVSYEAVRDFAAGRLKPGTRTYDLARHGMSLATSGGYLRPYQARLDALRRAVIDGRVVVPCVPVGLTGQAAIDAAAGPKCPH